MAKKEATIILLDVGENTEDVSGNEGASFFDRAKACVSKVIQKKIFGKPNDEVGVVLMGSDQTQNDLNRSLGEFENIQELIPLQQATWDMVRTVDKLQTSDISSDWVDGLVVALNFAKNESQAKKFTNVRILLLTNFLTATNDDNLDIIINSIQDSNIEIIAVSDCVEHTEQLKSSQFSQQPMSATQSDSQRLFSYLVEKVGGHLCHIDLVETQLLTFQKKASRAMPWNATITIGSRLKINVSAYVSVQEEKFLSSFKTSHDEANTITKMVTEYTVGNQMISKPDADDIIKAYTYGSNQVALHNEKPYENTDKCFSCLGFTKRELILNQFLAGKDSHLVLPQKGHDKSSALFGALVDSMKTNGLAMVARKVYRNNVKPQLVVLLPDFHDDIPYLTMIQLPFANDYTLFSFPKLRTKKSEPTKEQEKVIKELVDSMDLMNAVDNGSGLSEAFSLHTSLNPTNQHLCRSVAYRALHPNAPLPNIDPELMSMIDVPPKVKEARENVIKEVEEQFKLELVERKVRKVFAKSSDSAMFDEPMDTDSGVQEDEKHVIAVGTVNPIDDFTYLLQKGERFGVLAKQIESVIYDLIFRTASIQKEKTLECIMMYREQAKIYSPFDYNTWIVELKKAIVQRNRLDFWEDAIVKEKFGLISNNEAPISTVTVEDQFSFYEISAKDTCTSAMDTADDDDLDGLLD